MSASSASSGPLSTAAAKGDPGDVLGSGGGKLREFPFGEDPANLGGVAAIS